MLGCIMCMERGTTIPVVIIFTDMFVKLTQFAVNNTNLDKLMSLYLQHKKVLFISGW